MDTKRISDYCDIGILKAAFNIEVDQQIFVRWVITTEYRDDTSPRFLCSESTLDNEKLASDDNNLEEVGIERSKKRIRTNTSNDEVVWWPCKVRLPEKEERDQTGRRIFMLEYDEMRGIKSDKCKVVFENKEKVSHLDYNGLSLLYCRQDELEDHLANENNKSDLDETIKKQDSPDLESGIEEDADEDGTITIQEIIDNGLFGLSGTDESDSGGGGTGDSDSGGIVSIFNSLSHEKKINLAQGYREFADKFISFLRSRMEKDKDKNTITVEDVKDFIKSLGLDNENIESN